MSNDSSLKTAATKGMLWSAIDKFGVQVGQFVVGIVLARLLLPEDFGLIGMLSIFLAISNVFIASGMGSGLIQRQERTDVDFSTVFVFNFVVSTFFYIVLFFTAPLIADFYDQPILTLLTRTLGLTLFINSLAVVQSSKLIIAMDFKSIAKVNVIAIIVGGASGLTFAFLGFGVWALVIQALLSASASLISLWFYSKWKPSLTFSRDSFKSLFSYGSKLLLAGLYAQTLNNVYNITIGKYYPAVSLGYYTRAKGFAELSAGTITGILQQVTFPILASVQKDEKRMVSIYSRLIKMAAFFIFPLMTILSLLAEPIVLLLLTDKWAAVIPLMQWMVFARIFYPISVINMSILNAVGRSDLFLKVDLSKFPIILIALILTIPLGVKAMIIGHVVTSGLSFFINAYLPGKLYGYGGLKQLKDMLPVIISTLVMAGMVFTTAYFIENLHLKLLFGGLIGLISYLFMSYIFKAQELKEIKEILMKIRNK
jgi:O-antigen/teichoic acid export membrane protein